MQTLKVIKIGGNVISDPQVLASVLSQFSSLENPKLLVHGGGKQATELGSRLGVQAKMVDGRRITDAATLEIVTMIYGGLNNKQVVAKLQALGVNTLGVTGADGNLLKAKKRHHPTIDYGFVGDITPEDVNVPLLKKLLDAGLAPVFCALTHDGNGNLLNTNADTIASILAIALAKEFEVSLTYCFDKTGVLTDKDDDTTLIPEMTPESYLKHKTAGHITDGMLPKLDNAFGAIRQGVKEVWLKKAENLSIQKGTCLHPQ